MADKANITPDLLRWARETAKMSPEDAAKKVHIEPERLLLWEEGIELPTINQAQTLAKVYKRPFALFFLPEIPKDFTPLQDFRKTQVSLSTASVFIIREIQQKQAWMSEFNKENEESPLPFVGRFTLDSSPAEVAKDILKELQLSPLNYGDTKPIKEWINQAEKAGIFVSRTSFIHSRLKLNKEEILGFCIADPYAPFIFINTDDWDAPQLFTLVHELAHLWIAASGISVDIDPENVEHHQLHPVEMFCNEVAANALMPTEWLQSLNLNTFNNSKLVFEQSKRIGISAFALLVRAFNLQIISFQQYNKLKEQAEIEFKAFLQREELKKEKQKLKPGGPDPYLLRVNKNSRLFTQIVLDSFRGGLIEPTLASNLLNTQINKFPKLESFLYS